jgi:DNA-binding transcriptional ArsR family regulator
MVTIQDSQTDAVFRAIADPTRREILTILRERQLTVGELAANFKTSRPAISKHLRLLRNAGLVVSYKAGAASICELNPKPLKTVNTWLEDYRQLWSQSLHNLKRYVEQPANQKKDKQ